VEPSAWGYNWTALFLGAQILGPCPPVWESVESETVKYTHESHGTWTRERLGWRGPAAVVNDRPVISSERAPHTNKTVTV
jgi:hypothetical protein